MTPFEIDILLHYETRPGDHPLARNSPQIWRETIDSFVRDGLLEESDGKDSCFQGTEKLHVYCQALQSVPLPIQMWVVPQNGVAK